jgi:dipeptidase E
MSVNTSLRRVLLLSSSTVHPTGYLQYAHSYITSFLSASNTKKLLFVPYAIHDHDMYFERVSPAFQEMGLYRMEISSDKCNRNPVGKHSPISRSSKGDS